MFKVFLCSLMILTIHSAIGQTETFISSGKVLDASTQQPLSGASVFCQNTTFGTITNNEGNFSFKLLKGGYDLIISYTGFETQNIHINNTNATNITVELVKTDKNLMEVTVVGSTEVPDGMLKYGRFFLDNFIGTTPNASQCTIENSDVLQFYFTKKKNRLKIKAKEDLVITNNALGYTIKYQLDSFSYDYGTGIGTYSGYPFFEEIEGTDEQNIQWKQNRRRAYNGSRLHFVRAWYDSTLEEEGFKLEQVDPTKKVLTTKPIENVYDPEHYAVMDNEEVEINRIGKFRVIYKDEQPDKKFLTQYKLPASLKTQLTIVDIADAFIIEPNGYFYDQTDFINSGYWSWEKVAEALPYDYSPE
jgi:hypothetical protein